MKKLREVVKKDKAKPHHMDEADVIPISRKPNFREVRNQKWIDSQKSVKTTKPKKDYMDNVIDRKPLSFLDYALNDNSRKPRIVK